MNEYQNEETIKKISGMYEDWFWTAETVWEKFQFQNGAIKRIF